MAVAFYILAGLGAFAAAEAAGAFAGVLVLAWLAARMEALEH